MRRASSACRPAPRPFVGRVDVQRAPVPFRGGGGVAELEAVRIRQAREPVGVVPAIDVGVA